MGLSKFVAQKVFLDTAPLIYFIEGNSPHQAKLKDIFAALDKGEFTFVTSALTILEVLVQPIRKNRQDLVNQYKHILTTASGISIIEINTTIAFKAAELRAKYNLKTPDSIQVAVALEHGANYFFTNDFRLKTVTEIEIITVQNL